MTMLRPNQTKAKVTGLQRFPSRRFVGVSSLPQCQSHLNTSVQHGEGDGDSEQIDDLQLGERPRRYQGSIPLCLTRRVDMFAPPVRKLEENDQFFVGSAIIQHALIVIPLRTCCSVL